jgi:hypothetical protein
MRKMRKDDATFGRRDAAGEASVGQAELGLPHVRQVLQRHGRSAAAGADLTNRFGPQFTDKPSQGLLMETITYVSLSNNISPLDPLMCEEGVNKQVWIR